MPFLHARCCAKLFVCIILFQPQIGNEAERGSVCLKLTASEGQSWGLDPGPILLATPFPQKWGFISLPLFLLPALPGLCRSAQGRHASQNPYLGETERLLVELFLRPTYSPADWQGGCDRQVADY